MVAKIAGKVAKKTAKELDPEKLSTKARNAYDKSKKFIEEAVSDISIEDIDRAAGRAVDTAAGVGAVGAGVAAMTKGDNKSLKSQLRRIRAKDPSERTASEKRLLRLMEED